MTEYWFTSDCHFGHKNILKYTNRPFKSIGEMDYRLIQNWNARVKDEDTVFHIGDFCFKSAGGLKAQEYRQQLKGNIIFLAGNHDNNNSLKTCIHDISIYLGGKHLLLVHRPEESAYGYDLCLCGHIHQLYKFQTLKFRKYPAWDVCNVGVDAFGRPVTINEILDEYQTWKKTGIQLLAWV